MDEGDLDDEYVARLLKQDATDAKKKYELVGVGAFAPKRVRPAAPKPNTNFLRHIIRQTDSHNAALLAKEAKDSRERLREMDAGKTADERRNGRGRREQGRLTPPSEVESSTQRRRDRDRESGDEERDRRHKKRKSEHRGERSRRDRLRDREETRSRRDRSRSREEGRSRRKRSRDKDEGRSRRKSTRYADSSSDEEERSRHRKHSSRHHRRQSSSPPSKRHRSSRHHERSRSRSPRKSKSPDPARSSRTSKQRAPSADDDSDPLEAIVGPLPPPKQAPIRSRGRGAHKSNEGGIDARFSSTYDPTMDVEGPETDKWGDEVEAFRDRQRWKQQGAERLKAAGFSEDQVKKWENGDEKTEDDVKWSAKGQAREWDRGKVLDGDGDVKLKADWV